ncbi:MAG: TetR/AcrR family transcriptional regulator [Aurantibacter sp.]
MKSAIKLFNNKGLINVRLQQIADDSEISVGNLAYHYYSKKAIVEALDGQLGQELELLLSVDQNFPSLIDFDNHLGSYFHLINRYAFYFLDLLEMERAYPKIHAKRLEYIKKMIGQIHDWLVLTTNKSILKPEKVPDHYLHTAESIWMIITFWLTQRQVRGKSDVGEGNFKEFIWTQLFPLFTEQGWMECEAFILPQLKYYSETPDSLDFRNLT